VNAPLPSIPILAAHSSYPSSVGALKQRVINEGMAVHADKTVTDVKVRQKGLREALRDVSHPPLVSGPRADAARAPDCHIRSFLCQVSVVFEVWQICKYSYASGSVGLSAKESIRAAEIAVNVFHMVVSLVRQRNSVCGEIVS
jgi:hypothetical protein